MKILFACGGTGGHINPALAVADELRRRDKGIQILFAGNPDGMEAELVPKAGYDFVPIRIHGIQRRLSFENIKRNLLALRLLMSASSRAEKIIGDFAPDIVMGTGGYVSGPIVRKAARMGVKTLTHEQNAFPGVTTKLLSKHVDKVLLAVAEAKAYLPEGREYVVTGNPIRREFLLADRGEARLGSGVGGRVCILSFGGSLGAQRMNEAIAALMVWHRDRSDIHHIHATGRYGVELFPRLLREKGVEPDDYQHLDIREYIHDMPRCFAAADLVICRAGALSLSELQAAGKASILVPSPNVAENHQYHNAMVLAAKNAAIVIEERDLTGQGLVDIVEQLVQDPQEIKNLGRNAGLMAIIDATDRICGEIETLMKS